MNSINCVMFILFEHLFELNSYKITINKTLSMFIFNLLLYVQCWVLASIYKSLQFYIHQNTRNCSSIQTQSNQDKPPLVWFI